MSVPARDYNDLEVGDRVRYSTTVHGIRREGEGTVTLIWLGIEEMCDVVSDDGTKRTLCRAIGDRIDKA